MTATRQKAQFSDFLETVDAFRRGEMIVVADDERRENEGDLMMAAEKVDAAAVNFMITHGRGLLCIAMDRERLAHLGLARQMSPGGGDSFRTAFMESVDAREGVSTGISAEDRAHTIRVLIDAASTGADLIRPGHLFPLEAVPGGVLRRAGHTEAAVDLARLAGLKPAGAICEVLRADGSMARLPDLMAFARTHGLKIITVGMIAAHRRRTEALVRFEEEIHLPTEMGVFRTRMYHAWVDDKHHLALVFGEPSGVASPLVRVHSECLTGDAFGSLRCDCGSQLREAMEMIAQAGHGVLIYLRQEGRGIGLEQKIRAYALQEDGLDTVEANEQLGFEADLRDYSVAAHILKDLGIGKIRLITNNPRKIAGLGDYGIEVAERISLIRPRNEHSARYLATKKEKLGHLL